MTGGDKYGWHTKNKYDTSSIRKERHIVIKIINTRYGCLFIMLGLLKNE